MIAESNVFQNFIFQYYATDFTAKGLAKNLIVAKELQMISQPIFFTMITKRGLPCNPVISLATTF